MSRRNTDLLETFENLIGTVAETIFNGDDFTKSVESVIDDYDMDDKIENVVNNHDFGVSDLSDRVDNVENLAEDAIGRYDDVANRLGSLEKDFMTQLKENARMLEFNDALLELISGLRERIEQLENASVDWNELLTL